MAHYAEMNLEGNIIIQCNIDDTVGITGKNKRLDVMMIQALINELNDTISKQEGLEDDGEKLTVDGIWSDSLANMLRSYHKTRSSYLLSKRFDGLIHPANYVQRKLHHGKSLMIITALSYQALHVPIPHHSPRLRLNRWSPELFGLPLKKWGKN